MSRRPTIGVQMSTIKREVSTLGIEECFRRCADIGYRCIEVSQVPMTEANVAAMRKAIDDTGVRVTSMSAAVEPMMPGAGGESLSEHFDKIVNDCRALDCSLLRIGMLPIPFLADPVAALAFVDRAEAMAVRLREVGIDLYYHNHHAELLLHERVPLLDQFRERTATLGFELDIHWLHRGGVDPVDYINRFAGRVRMLHLKDYRIAPLRLPEGRFDPATFLPAFYNLVEFAEVGEGTLPTARCIEAGTAAGCEFFFVEQDDTYGRDPFESLALSRQNLIDMGYDWFELPS